ncbi:hypothetical protein BCR37DRAFT_333979, partial [Protomyces lactucae-debilis]
VVLHVLTTGDEYGVCVSKDVSETIEIAWLLLEASTLRVMNQGSCLVRPVSTPITDLCTNITSLQYEDVQDAGSFARAIQKLQSAITELADLERTAFSFVSMDAWDLTIQLPREARDKAVVLPYWLEHARVYELAEAFFFLHKEGLAPAPAAGMQKSSSNLCTSLGLQVISRLADRMPGTPAVSPQTMQPGSKPRRAMDECHNMFSILRSLLRLSQPIWQTKFPFSQPIDGLADYVTFEEENSRVLFLTNLPAETTQSELESWSTQHGTRPVAFWTLRAPDLQPPPGVGFAIFATHDEATHGLSLNGRALGDKIIKVSPSSPMLLDTAASLLTSFPASKNRPRPGDWLCGLCGFSNFQRRQACFRCACPATMVRDSAARGNMVQSAGMPVAAAAAAAAATGYFQQTHYNGYTSPPMQNYGLLSPGLSLPSSTVVTPTSPVFRAGDWHCGLCAFHNFARNIACLKCSAQR